MRLAAAMRKMLDPILCAEMSARAWSFAQDSRTSIILARCWGFTSKFYKRAAHDIVRTIESPGAGDRRDLLRRGGADAADARILQRGRGAERFDGARDSPHWKLAGSHASRRNATGETAAGGVDHRCGDPPANADRHSIERSRSCATAHSVGSRGTCARLRMLAACIVALATFCMTLAVLDGKELDAALVALMVSVSTLLMLRFCRYATTDIYLAMFVAIANACLAARFSSRDGSVDVLALASRWALRC